eukprot:6172539-Pleurochrysis_carterae.AAC.2
MEAQTLPEDNCENKHCRHATAKLRELRLKITQLGDAQVASVQRDALVQRDTPVQMLARMPAKTDFQKQVFQHRDRLRTDMLFCINVKKLSDFPTERGAKGNIEEERECIEENAEGASPRKKGEEYFTGQGNVESERARAQPRERKRACAS